MLKPPSKGKCHKMFLKYTTEWQQIGYIHGFLLLEVVHSKRVYQRVLCFQKSQKTSEEVKVIPKSKKAAAVFDESSDVSQSFVVLLKQVILKMEKTWNVIISIFLES